MKDGEKAAEGDKKKEEKKGPVCSDLSQLESFWQATGQAPKEDNYIIKYDGPKDFNSVP